MGTKLCLLLIKSNYKFKSYKDTEERINQYINILSYQNGKMSFSQTTTEVN